MLHLQKIRFIRDNHGKACPLYLFSCFKCCLGHFFLPKNEPKKAPRTALAFGTTRLPLIKAALQKLAEFMPVVWVLRHAAMLFALPSSLLAQVWMGKNKIKNLKSRDCTAIRDEPKRSWLAALVLGVCFIVFPGSTFGAERITLQAADGFPLVGLYEKGEGDATSQPAVLLLHMFNRQKESWQPLTAALKKRGISSLALDLRGHGESRLDAAGVDQHFRVAERDSVFFNQMYKDGLAAVAWLRSHGHQPLGVVGASVGCSVAMHMVVAAKLELGAMVLMTPGRDYLGIDTLSHLEQWPGLPLLILTSAEEAERGAVTIYERLHGQGAELVVFEQGAIHGTMMFGEVEGVEARISSWLAGKVR